MANTLTLKRPRITSSNCIRPRSGEERDSDQLPDVSLEAPDLSANAHLAARCAETYLSSMQTITQGAVGAYADGYRDGVEVYRELLKDLVGEHSSVSLAEAKDILKKMQSYLARNAYLSVSDDETLGCRDHGMHDSLSACANRLDSLISSRLAAPAPRLAA